MTLSGNHADELISASLTGDLTDAERAEMDAHLVRCERCRATLAAFRIERRVLAAMPPSDPPRDLPARVRAGIESGRLGTPWWRRPGSTVPLLASAAVFSAVILAFVVLGKLPTGPAGLASESPRATLSSAPSNSTAASVVPSSGPSAPPTFLAPGQLGYLQATGASLQPLKLSFINDAGASIDLGTVSGPPIAASLSPDGQWLAYITQKGETGANEVWAVHLADGAITPLGCSLAWPFADRLVWSADNAYLAYTIAAVDLGPTAGCPDLGATGGTDVWMFDTQIRQSSRFTTTGDAYAATFWPDSHALMVSHAAKAPWSETPPLVADAPYPGKVEGVFMPLFSPDGNRALFWSGTMASTTGMWQFSRGGMPQVSGDFRSAGPASPWLGTPLFTDLTPVGGEAFAFGSYAWNPDSDHFAFWQGAWTGAPQSADGTYPMDSDLFVGSIGDGLLSAKSRYASDLTATGRVVDATFGSTPPNIGRGFELAVTIGYSSAGIGDVPSAKITIFTVCCGGENVVIGGGVSPPPWDGPLVYGR